MYYNGTNYVRLAKGSDDEVLTLASGIPSWAAASAGGLGYSNSNAATAPGGSGNYDLAEPAAQDGDETPFEDNIDAFSVIKVSVFDCEDPIGSISTVDYGSGEAYCGA
jgi:hypothetical protein